MQDLYRNCPMLRVLKSDNVKSVQVKSSHEFTKVYQVKSSASVVEKATHRWC